MKFGIIVFPGSNCDRDCFHVVRDVLGAQAKFIWHKETSVSGFDCLILPGGFSYGDYLRSGAMAAHSPVMNAVKNFAEAGGFVLGICNGFQILCEAGLLPGVLFRNKTLKFICKNVNVRIERTDIPFTFACKQGEVMNLPIAHMDGNYFIEKKKFEAMERAGQVIMRYSDESGEVTDDSNPNGAVGSVAGLVNSKGNVCGMMPHPERVSEKILGSVTGLKIFKSIVDSLPLKGKE